MRIVLDTNVALFDRTARDLLTDYIEAVDLVTPFAIPAVVSADPDDDQVIATAVAGQAEVICTRDRHLFHSYVQSACAALGIRIATDVDLLQELRALAGPQP